ncbi:MAG: hypothetical protein SFU86_19895 [Pirellulaceae bacterium]|nr:hypothetical protein [Pirellulaceae bacterium]
MKGSDHQASATAPLRAAARKSISIWCVAGFLVVVAGIALAEWWWPYFFSQDDVLVGELPAILWQWRNLLKGLWVTYNPYILLGAPAGHLGGGTTYPPSFLAYLYARFVLGNEFATAEVLAVFHLLATYGAVYLTVRRLDCGPMPAALGGATVALGGPTLILGRCWHSFLPIGLYMTLLVYLVIRLREGPIGWRWMLATGLVVGLFYHVGFPQTWFYAVGFFSLAVGWLALTGSVPLARAAVSLPAIGIGISLAWPVIAMQMAAARNMQHMASYGNGVGWDFVGMLLPFPLFGAPNPNGWGSVFWEYSAEMYYFGTVFVIFFAVSCWRMMATALQRRPIPEWGDSVWTIAALVAFWLALGTAGGLWNVVSSLPVVGGVNNHPFRLIPFIVVFVVLSGGMSLERWLENQPRRRTIEIVLGSCGFLLLLYHVTCCKGAFFTYLFAPYPTLPRELVQRIVENDGQPIQRVASISPFRCVSPTYGLALPHNLPTIYGVVSTLGYDPVTERSQTWRNALEAMSENPAEGARAFGIRWCLIHRASIEPQLSPNRVGHSLETLIELATLAKFVKLDTAVELAEAPDIILAELPGAAPLAFASNRPDSALPLELHCHGIDVDTCSVSQASEVTVGFLWYPQMRAYADGKPVACQHDSWNRLLVAIPAGCRKLQLICEVRWWPPILQAGAMLLASLGVAFAILRWQPSVDTNASQAGPAKTGPASSGV